MGHSDEKINKSQKIPDWLSLPGQPEKIVDPEHCCNLLKVWIKFIFEKH
jgi:hypothetical protein